MTKKLNGTETGAQILAVDIGTTSVRAFVFDAEGTILGKAQVAYPTKRPKPYFEEQDPDLVKASTFAAIRSLFESGQAKPESIRGISFSSQMYSLIALDEAGMPLTNSILWSDGRAERQALRLKEAFGPLGLYRFTGCPMNSIYPIAKIAWLREEEPLVFRHAARFVSIKEYVAKDIIGRWAVDYSMASASGLFDVAAHRWHGPALEAVGIAEANLSTPVSGTCTFTLIDNSPLADLGLSKVLPIFLGAGDGPLANLGSGAVEVGAINIDLGTSGAARCTTGAAVVDETASLWCFCLDETRWAYGGIVTNVGNAYQWLASSVAEVSGMSPEAAFEFLNAKAKAIEPGSKGLLFMPYLRKAVAYDLKTIIELMDRRGPTLAHIVLTGGLSRSLVVPDILADVLGREIRIPSQNEGSIAGAAILGFMGLGMEAWFGDGNAGASVYPDRGRSAIYAEHYRNYTALVERLRGFGAPGRENP
ncbi:MAG: gluconokinase [Spirochaetes bacterium]|nr:MAG: gluconokinase [Spirochaetota bacterium]